MNDPPDVVRMLAKIVTMEVNIHDAKIHLSRLLEKVSVGEEVIIAKRASPWRNSFPSNALRRSGFGEAKGDFVVPNDFNDPLPKEIEDSFYK